MSENRDPIAILIKKLPNSDGKKKGCRLAIKIEMFPSHYWSDNWFPASAEWSPKLPLKTQTRNEYWENRFRLRINGTWHSPDARYTTFNEGEIYEMFKNLGESQ